MKIEIPGLNVEAGLDLYDDDEEIYLTVLRSFAVNTPAVLDRLRNVTAETLPDYAIAIHGIKGTSVNIGAQEIQKTAARLETMAMAGDLAGVKLMNDAFLKRADALLAGINDWLKRHGV